MQKKGVNVLLTYNSKKDEAQAVVAEIEKTGQKAAALQLDTTDIKSFGDFFNKVSSTLKDVFAADRLDFLVNNAGVGIHASFAETTEEQFDMLMNIHFKGVFFLTQKGCVAAY